MLSRKKNLLLTLSMLTVLELVSMPPAQAANPMNTSETVAAGTVLIKQKKYKEATSLFTEAVKRNPKNTVLQYYLGLACLYEGNRKAAELSLARAVAMSPGDSKINQQSSDLMYKYWRYRPYSCCVSYTNPPQTVRWSRKKMPLAIWIADGKMLDNRLNRKIMTGQESREVGLSLRNPSFLARLETSKMYKPVHKAALLKGINEWQWAVRERLFNYVFTNNPNAADIVVFWSNELRGFGGWAYHPIMVPEDPTPVIIVMCLEGSTDGSEESFCKSLERVVTHEFGHALGLDHSKNQEDLMHAKRTVDTFSKGDYASVRALYSTPSDLTLPSVSKHN